MAIKQKSLKAHVEETASLFLATCGFKIKFEFFEGIILLLDLLAFYKEEGKELYPEVFVLHNNEANLFNYLKGEKREVFFKNAEITQNNFRKFLKALAPLCTKGWICYFEIHPNGTLMNVGIVSVAENETSVSFKDQVMPMLDDGTCKCPAFFIDNLGNRTIYLSGAEENKLFISFSLSEAGNLDELQIPKLTENVLLNIKDDKRLSYIAYVNRFFIETFKNGHGNLIGIINNTPKITAHLPKFLDGFIFSEPIDFYQYLKLAFDSKEVEIHYNLQHYADLLSNMINFDGITVLSTDFKIIGYNLFIKPEVLNKEVGGSRTRAFAAMEKSSIFKFGFFKSQDGNEKIFEQ